jgi:hypothetical protein
MSQGQFLRCSVDRVPEDPGAFWLARRDSESQPGCQSQFDRFMVWLRGKPGWEKAGPRESLIRHPESQDPHFVLDLVQEYVNVALAGKRKNSKRKAYSVIRSYFMQNRAALPVDPAFRIRGDPQPVQGKLTAKDILETVHAADPRYRSVMLFKGQSFQDNERTEYINRHRSDQVVSQIQSGVHPVRVDLPGRKINENDQEGAYFTYICQLATQDDEKGEYFSSPSSLR